MPLDSHFKSLAKAMSWRLIGSLDTFLLSFLFTAHLGVATSIAFTELFTKVALYWLHERIWLRF